MKSSGVGGQAVLEGVMMKNKEKYAIAVRKPDNEIVVEVSEYKGLNDKFPFFNLPIFRGVAAFVDSLTIGVKALTFSSSFFEEEEESDKNEKKDGKEGKGSEGFFTFVTFFLSIILTVGVFIILPFFISELISNKIESQFLLSLIEGAIRIALFVGYVVAISQMKDIKRFFQYHGAEHKSINCIEKGFELTVENVRRQTKEHRRCGTSFMLFVMLISIIFFMFIRVDIIWLRYVLRILLIPVVAGVSYEVIRLAGRTNNIAIRIISAPGMWMQGLTTKEPDDSMIEVAIQSVEAVFDWKAYLADNKKGSHGKKKANYQNISASKQEGKSSEPQSKNVGKQEGKSSEPQSKNVGKQEGKSSEPQNKKIGKQEGKSSEPQNKKIGKQEGKSSEPQNKKIGKQEEKLNIHHNEKENLQKDNNIGNNKKNVNSQKNKNNGEKEVINKEKEIAKEIVEELAAVEELSSLDKNLFEPRELAPEEKQSQLKEKVKPRHTEVKLSSTEIAASLEPHDDEDDVILKALDRYLAFDKEENGRGE